MKHQSGNTLPPKRDVNFAAWKAKSLGKKESDGDPGLAESVEDSNPPPTKLPSAIQATKDEDGNKNPNPDPAPKETKPDEISGGQRAALVTGGIAAGTVLLGTLGLLVGRGWKKITKARKDKEKMEKIRGLAIPQRTLES